MQTKILKSSSRKPGQNTETATIQDPLQRKSAEFSEHGTPPNIDVDYGITTDAYGPEESEQIWDAEIGQPPPVE